MKRAPDPNWLGVATRLFDAALWLYPAALRRAHGEEMRQVFRDRCREGATGSRGIARLFLLELLPDTVHSAARAHWDTGFREARSRHGYAFAMLVLALLLLVFQDAFSNRLIELTYKTRYAYFNAQAARQLGEEERHVRALADLLARESSPASNAQAAYLYRILYEQRPAYTIARESAEEAMMAARALDGNPGEITRDGESLGVLVADGARATAAVDETIRAEQSGWIAAAAVKSCVPAAGCDRTAAIRRLTVLEPDNAYGWSLAFKEASTRGNSEQMRIALQRMGTSTRYDDHLGALRSAIFASARRLLPDDQETRGLVAMRMPWSGYIDTEDLENDVRYQCRLSTWQGPGWARTHPESEGDCLRVAKLLAHSDSPYTAFFGRSLVAERDPSPEAVIQKSLARKFVLDSSRYGSSPKAGSNRWQAWTMNEWNDWADLWTPGATEASVARRQIALSSH